MNNVQFDPYDPFLIVNSETGKAIESQPSLARAEHACNNLNEHERINGRSEVYVVKPRPERT